MFFREARRFLRSSPLLGLSAVVVLALGIGASALTLGLLLALSSLSYPGMRAIGYATVAEETEGGGSIPITWHRFEELRRSSSQSPTVAAYSRLINTTLELNGGNRPLRVAAISGGFFSRLTAGLIVGRDFNSIEENESNRHVTILSLSLATSLFHSPDIALGQFLVINGLPYEVVGVAPSGFRGVFGDSVEAWVPANCVVPLILNPPPSGLPGPDIWKRSAAFYGLVASDRFSATELVAELNRLPLILASTEGPLHVSQGLTTDPMRDARLRKWLRLGLLLAVVFTIVSSLDYSLLLLARAPRYAEEVRLKKALGAGSGRLVTELMVGPAAMVGVGLLVACLFWAVSLVLISRLSEFYGQLVRGSWQQAVLAFGVQVPLACMLTLVIALIPTIGLLRDDCAPRMGYTSTATRRASFLLQALVTLQITLCIGTWILTGMVLAAVSSLMREPLGYNPSHLTAVCIRPMSGAVTFTVGAENKSSFPTPSAIESLLEQVSAMPGVRSVSFASSAPFGQPMGTLTLQRVDSTLETPRTVYEMEVSSEYFRTLETRFVRGRDFSSHDPTGGMHEIIINETLARELWPNDNPVNRSVRLNDPGLGGIPSHTFSVTIVGVVEDMRLSGFTASPEPTVFLSVKGLAFFDITPDLIVNGSESLFSLQNVTSRQVPALMPGLGVLYAYSVDDRAQASHWQVQEPAYFALAGGLAMALVAYIGLYGALAYYVGTRRRELAVRVCLGAPPSGIRKIILARAASCAVSAVILSLPLWPVLAQLSSNDYLGRVSWSTGRAVLISLACVSASVVVSLVPAIDAESVSPSEVLKEQ